MRLCYRGVPYEYNPPAVDVTEGQPVGKYRGAACYFPTVRPSVQKFSPLVVTYRGARAYLTATLQGYALS